MEQTINFSAVVAPIIISLELRAPTTVRKWWIRPQLSVTGYVVHYSLAGGIGSDGNKFISAGSTGADITSLVCGQTYIFSVEVISNSPNILPRVSERWNITLHELFLLHVASMLHTSDLSFTAPEIPKDLEITLDPGLVRVSWHAVDDTDSYTIIFSQVQGPSQEGLCPTYFHTASLTMLPT